MKASLICLFFSFCVYSSAQRVEGKYRDHFGDKIELNSDHTFLFTWGFDLFSSWTRGVWEQKGNMIHFSAIPIYDTVSLPNALNAPVDTLVLSGNFSSERIKSDEYLIEQISSGGQNKWAHPDSLLFLNGNLYPVLNNKPLKETRSLMGTEKYDPWYTRVPD